MHYVYHPHHEAVIVSPEEYQNYLDNGWFDSPAKFPNESMAKPELMDEPEPVEASPKKKGRPPKAKAEEVPASVEL